MSSAIEQKPQQQAASQPPSTDAVLLLVVGIVVALVLGATGYLCVVYRSLAGPIGAIGGVA
ncbi:hypothetical protein ACFYP6_33900 [Streptomyces goshikiensis]|uniref:hypothetical protein n=1 Tax=Streptomyces goshikiensis TaxID=1942 RepID=UPI0036CCEAA0